MHLSIIASLLKLTAVEKASQPVIVVTRLMGRKKIMKFIISIVIGLTGSVFALAYESSSSDMGLKTTWQKQPEKSITQFENRIRALDERDNGAAQRWTVAERMAARGVPGVGLAILEDGEIVLAKGYGSLSARGDQPVNADTVFSVGSVSKMVNAALIMRLAQATYIDLDTDINNYLKRWKVPDSRFTKQKKVTLRYILAHTAGFSQHGFADFQPGDSLPTTLETLKGSGPARHRPIRLMFEPGTQMDYSGGGITVSQLLVEDVTGMTYEEAARHYVFDPLGMTRSTFVNPLPETHGNIAKAHDRKGLMRALPRGYEAMPEAAASGLWTSASDMAKFMKAMMLDETFLSPAMRADMLTRVSHSWHGLGPRINGEGKSLVFHHGGSNDSYKAWIEGHPYTGNAIIILTNGADGQRLGYELRIGVGESLGWAIQFPDAFVEPKFE